MIYMDYAANTPADPAVLEAFLKAERTYLGNPNSNHPAGQAAREEMARVTNAIAALLGVSPGRSSTPPGPASRTIWLSRGLPRPAVLQESTSSPPRWSTPL